MNSLELIVAMVRFETSELGVSEQETVHQHTGIWYGLLLSRSGAIFIM